MVDNSGPGRWTREGRIPELTEAWRVRLGERGESMPLAAIPQLRGVRADGTVEMYDFGTGVLLEVSADGEVPVSERPLPFVLGSALAGAGATPGEPADRVAYTLALPTGGVLIGQTPQRIEGGAPERMAGFVLRYLPGGAVPDTLYATSIQVLGGDEFTDWPRPGSTFPLAAVGPAGAIALGGATVRYRIDVLGADLADSLVVCRRAQAVPLTDAETGSVELPGSPAGLPGLLRKLRKVKPPLAFGRFFFGAEGQLWVQRERPEPQRFYAQPPGAAYDVFAAGGAYLGEVRAPEGGVLFGSARGLVYGLETMEDGQSFVVAYALE